MKELYHGSLEIVTSPEIRRPNRTLDYGAGFYLTSSAEQAESWVRRKFRGDISLGYVNCYDYDENQAIGLNKLSFDSPDEEWLDFVMENRMNPAFSHNYDIVEGPVANDRVYASFAIYEAGLIDKNELISELRAYKLVNQILLHTDQALTCVYWRGAKEITR